MSGNNVRIAASLDDQVSGRLDRIKDKFGQLGKSEGFKSIVQGAGIGVGLSGWHLLEEGIGKVVDVLSDAVKAAEENQVAQEALNVSVAANTKEHRDYSAAVDEATKAGERLGFQNNEQLSALAGLVAATHDVSKAIDVMRVAEDLARFKHISLEEASQDLVKVEAGRYRALAGLGIILKKGASQEEALAAVRKVTAGQAVAYAQTVTGAQEVMNAEVEAAEEKIGNALLPALRDLALFVADNVGPAIDNLAAAFGALTPIWSAEIDAVKFLLSPLGNLLDVIDGLIVNFLVVQGGVEGFQKNLQGLGDVVQTLGLPLKFLADGVAQTADVMTHLTGPLEQVSTGAGKMADDTERAAERMTGTFRNAGKAIDDTVQTVLTRDFNTELPAALEEGTKKAYKIARDTPRQIADALKAGRNEWQQALQELQDDTKTSMSTAAEIAYLRSKDVAQKIADGLKSKDPVVRARAAALQETVRARLAQLTGQVAVIGEKAAAGFAKGIADGHNTAAQKAELVRLAAANALGKLPSQAYGWGADVPKQYAAGMNANRQLAGSAADLLAHLVWKKLHLASPAKEGPLSEDGGPEGWGRKFSEDWAKGMRSTMPAIATPGRGSGVSYAGGGIGGGATIHVHLPPTPIPYSAAQWNEVARAFVPEMTRELRRAGAI